MLLSMFFVTNISGFPMDYYIGRVGLAVAHGPYSEAEVFFECKAGSLMIPVWPGLREWKIGGLSKM